MSEALEVLRRPIITEKSTLLREGNRYAFEVEPWASKGQIRQAIESRFKVNVINVRTVKVLGKFRRRTGPQGGYQPNRKKAIVRVQQGQTIKWEEVA
jgi:large subunit ribosomal protein L23